MYVYSVVCYCMIVALCVRNVCYGFAHLYTLVDDSLPKVVLLCYKMVYAYVIILFVT